MENDSEKQLQELIHRELRKLPDLQAPPTLILRVRSALATQARQPWWQRPLVTWPLAMRVAFIALLVGSLGFAGLYGVGVSDGMNFAFQKGTERFASFTPLWEHLVALANAGLILCRALSSHFLIYASLLVGTTYLACAGVGTLLFRVSFAKR